MKGFTNQSKTPEDQWVVIEVGDDQSVWNDIMRFFFLEEHSEKRTEYVKTGSRYGDVAIIQMGNYSNQDVHTSCGKWR